MTYFELGSATSAPPAVIDYDGDEPFVLWDPAGGLKAALHARGPLTDPDQPAAAEPGCGGTASRRGSTRHSPA